MPVGRPRRPDKVKIGLCVDSITVERLDALNAKSGVYKSRLVQEAVEVYERKYENALHMLQKKYKIKNIPSGTVMTYIKMEEELKR